MCPCAIENGRSAEGQRFEVFGSAFTLFGALAEAERKGKQEQRFRLTWRKRCRQVAGFFKRVEKTVGGNGIVRQDQVRWYLFSHSIPSNCSRNLDTANSYANRMVYLQMDISKRLHQSTPKIQFDL